MKHHLILVLILLPILFTPFLYPKTAKGNFIGDSMTFFWEGKTIFNESVLFVSYSGGLPEAKLLFTPKNIIAVKNSALNKTYVQGADWVYNNGKLQLPPGSAISYLKDTDIIPPILNEGIYFHTKQAAITYTHDDSWTGPITSYVGTTKLPNTINKLKSHSPLKLVVFGDSIAVGGNASRLYNSPPNMPTWGQLVSNKLQQVYGTNIIYSNPSVSGTTSSWGAQNVENLVSNLYPDLVIIAFGMNDGATQVSATEYTNNLSTIIQSIKSKNPHAEFILVSPILPNPSWRNWTIQQTYSPALNNLISASVAKVDMTGVHQELLKTKKYSDMTGNNINHPNDFLIRWYAQEIVGLLIPSPSSTPTTFNLADLNRSGKVDIFDYNAFVGDYGKTGAPGFVPADMKRDGAVNIFDYNVLVANFGE